MPARKNFTEARKHRIARYSKFNQVKDTAERFDVHFNMILRYRKMYGITRKGKANKSVSEAIKIHKNATSENAFHCSHPHPLPQFLMVLRH